jgi:excisionase family DNA binding protein
LEQANYNSFEVAIPLREAADQTGVQYHRLRKAAGEGRMRAQKIGNQYMVQLSEVGRFLREGDGRRRPAASNPVRPDIQVNKPENPPTSTTRIMQERVAILTILAGWQELAKDEDIRATALEAAQTLDIHLQQLLNYLQKPLS